MADTSAAKRRLIEIVKARSFSTGGETKLVSGRSTTFYFNMKPSMLHPEGAHLIATLILDALEGAQGRLHRRAGDGRGAAGDGRVRHEPRPGPAAAAPSSCASRPRSTAPASWWKGLAPGETLQGKRVVILEDVTTTGGSSMKAIEAVRAEGAIIERVITVVDRLEGAAETFKAAGIPFQALLTTADFR